MKSGKCPKCCGKDVRIQQDFGYRNGLVVSAFSVAHLQNYICVGCGYVESYILPEHLKRVRDKLPVVKTEP